MDSTHLSDSDLLDLANIFRIHCIEMTEAPKSGYYRYKLNKLLNIKSTVMLLHVHQWLN